jgi:hypothetical protein
VSAQSKLVVNTSTLSKTMRVIHVCQQVGDALIGAIQVVNNCVNTRHERIERGAAQRGAASQEAGVQGAQPPARPKTACQQTRQRSKKVQGHKQPKTQRILTLQ